ncbi:MAG: PTS sugar transporter subunit IIB [Clostridium sp.]|uniref:PTS sugar transporter subunit IIB n=1 Tax=Clostridium sp. TaxID=1506 RepID=UPI003F325F0A
MKKILLVCNAGMSTSLLVAKMKEAASSMGLECEIYAHPISSVKEKGLDCDIILLGPQVRFQLKKVKDMLPGKLVDVIDIQAYGTMDGAKVIAKAKETMGV